MELLLLGIFSAVLLACIFTGVSVIYAMLLGLVVFFGYGLIKKKTWKQMLIFSWKEMKTAKNVLLTFMLIGMMTVIWRASGSIAFIVYYASEICVPSILRQIVINSADEQSNFFFLAAVSTAHSKSF